MLEDEVDEDADVETLIIGVHNHDVFVLVFVVLMILHCFISLQNPRNSSDSFILQISISTLNTCSSSLIDLRSVSLGKMTITIAFCCRICA